MQIELTDLEYRRLLDMVYIGNWVLNAYRGTDRITDYDYKQGKLFAYAPLHGMKSLTELRMHLVSKVELHILTLVPIRLR